jgi:hypothetical protein
MSCFFNRKQGQVFTTLRSKWGKIVSSVKKLTAQINGKLSFEALNPKENVSVIKLRSGKELEKQRSKQIKMEEEEEIEIKLSIKKKQSTPPQIETTTNTPKVSLNLMNFNFRKISPFPLSSSRFKKEDKEKEILEIFKKMKLNIPLIKICQILEGVVYYQKSFQAKSL